MKHITCFLLVLHAHLPYQIVCGDLHAVLCMGQRTRTPWLYMPQGQLYLECVHHIADTKFSCCAEYVAISYMKVAKKNINKSKAWIYMLFDNKIVIGWRVYFLYRALYGRSSAGDGECVWNQVHGSRVCVCFLLVPWKGFGNPFFNKRNRVWITERNCYPWDRECEPIVCIGG